MSKIAPERPTGQFYAVLGLAWSFGWPMAAGVVVGGWVDQELGSAPFAILFCTLGALVATVRRVLQVLAVKPPGSDPEAPADPDRGGGSDGGESR